MVRIRKVPKCAETQEKQPEGKAKHEHVNMPAERHYIQPAYFRVLP